MTANRLHCAIAIALFASLAMVGCNREPDDAVGAPPVADEIEPLPPIDEATDPMTAPTDEPMAPGTTQPETALDVSSVTLGTEAGDDNGLEAELTTFAPTDDIIVSVETEGAASDAEIEARLVYQDGQPAGEESETVTTTGAETTNITFTNAKPWPTGEYTAEVWINGTQAETVSFNVR